MDMNNDHIFSGPEVNFEIFGGSFGQYVANRLLNAPLDEIAQIDGQTGETMTKGAFVKLSGRIGAGLTGLGVSAGDLVVLLGENSHRVFAVATACILMDVPIAPLDPQLRPFELKNIFKSYQPRVVFCNHRQTNDVLKTLDELDMKIPIILLDKDTSHDPLVLGFSAVEEHEPKIVDPPGVSDPCKDVAIVIPSSGSTGTPKGVAISHRTAVFLCMKLESATREWGSRSAGFSLQTSHLFWISGMYSLFGCYLGQKRIFLSSLDTTTIIQTIKKYKPVFTFLSPSHLASILKYPGLQRDDLSSLKLIVTGGGSLQPFVVNQMKEKLETPPLLIQAYGLTENAGGVTPFVPGSDIFSVGKVDSGVHVKIVDLNTGAILGPGETGEIRVLCQYQFLHYLGNPEATKEAFDEDGWLRTGDLGYFTEDGLLYIVGRIKTVIKYRNMQISTTEIESLLIGMPGVEDVGVDGIPHEEDQYHAIALIVKSPGSTITEGDVHKHVEENMSPQNKLRGGVFFVDSIPRTAHQKIKRHELNQMASQLYNGMASQPDNGTKN